MNILLSHAVCGESTMKKIIVLCALVLSFSCVPLFSENSSKTSGFAFGARFSTLGVEPTVSILMNKMEIEASCAATRYGNDWSEASFSVVPGVSLGYTPSSFSSGWKNSVGAAYNWFMPSFFKYTPNFSGVGFAQLQSGGAHIFSLYYRGGLKFGIFELYGRIIVPIAMYAPGVSGNQFLTIIDVDGVTSSVAFCMQTCSFGVRFAL